MFCNAKPHKSAVQFALIFSVAGFLLTSPDSPALAKDISVSIDQAKMLRLQQPGAEIIIGNPSIADVSVQNAHLLVITGKSFGITNLIVLNAQGHEILNERLRVKTDNKRQVSLYKGSNRQSYDCTGRCESALVPGDDVKYFDNVSKSITGKFGVAQSALDGGAGSQ